MKKLKGIPASPGIGIGRARKINNNSFFIFKEEKIEDKYVGNEIERFYESIKRTEEEILKVKTNIEKFAGKEYAEIFSFYISILRDKK